MSDEIQKLISEISFYKEAQIKQIKKLQGDASTRMYYRVTSSLGVHIVCLNALGPEKDFNFYHATKFLAERGLTVPEVHYYSEEQKLIVQEDLGQVHLINALKGDRARELQYYKLALDEALKLHSIKSGKIANFNHSFDEKKLMTEVAITNSNFLEKTLKATSDQVQLINDTFYKIVKRIEKLPRVFVHRDYHARNILVREDQLVLIDYQDGRLGHPTYDLCSLLDDCYYRLPTDVKNELLNYYYDKATKVGVITESKADFMNNYYLSAAQRIYKAIGTFHLQYHDKNNDRYLKHVGHAFENLKMTLTKLGDRRESLDLLCELYYDC